MAEHPPTGEEEPFHSRLESLLGLLFYAAAKKKKKKNEKPAKAPAEAK